MSRDQRDDILNRIRASLGVTADDHDRRLQAQKHIFGHRPGIIPARSLQDRAALVAQFRDHLESQSADVTELADPDEIPAVVAADLRAQNLPLTVRTGDDDWLAALPWADQAALTRETGPARDGDEATVSRAIAGVSETGTLILASGSANPTTLNFLPTRHIIVLRTDDLVGPYEDVWQRLREIYGEGRMPRALNMVSGPSRTADIEQTLIKGAHGPISMHVLLAG